MLPNVTTQPQVVLTKPAALTG